MQDQWIQRANHIGDWSLYSWDNAAWFPTCRRTASRAGWQWTLAHHRADNGNERRVWEHVRSSPLPWVQPTMVPSFTTRIRWLFVKTWATWHGNEGSVTSLHSREVTKLPQATKSTYTVCAQVEGGRWVLEGFIGGSKGTRTCNKVKCPLLLEI